MTYSRECVVCRDVYPVDEMHVGGVCEACYDPDAVSERPKKSSNEECDPPGAGDSS